VFIPPEGSGGARGGEASSSAYAAGGWSIVNVPPSTKVPNDGLCGTFNESEGCGFDPQAPAGHECDSVNGGPGAAMRDHEIFAVTWADPSDEPGQPLGEASATVALAGAPSRVEGGPVIDVKHLRLSNGQPGSPLVWSPSLSSPLGKPLRNVGLRLVNRTEAYRCKPRLAPSAKPAPKPAARPA